MSTAAPAGNPPRTTGATTGRRTGRADGVLLVGAAAVLFPMVYLLSDVVEVVQGDFTVFRLSLTYAGEAGFPLLVIGLAAAVHDRLPRWAVLGAVAYAYSFVFFTSTVVWAIVDRAPDWDAVGDAFGPWLTVHGAIMVVGGLALGGGIVRTGALPRWTGWALAVGVVLVAALSGAGNLERTLAAAVPDAALVGMGVELLRRHRVGVR